MKIPFWPFSKKKSIINDPIIGWPWCKAHSLEEELVALLHHLWIERSGGIPQEDNTKPFIFMDNWKKAQLLAIKYLQCDKNEIRSILR